MDAINEEPVVVEEWDPSSDRAEINTEYASLVPRDHRGRFKPASIGEWEPDRDGQRKIDAEARAHKKMIDGMKERMGIPVDPRPAQPRRHVAVEKPITPREPRPIVQPKARSDPRPDLPRDPVERMRARQRERDASIQRKQLVGGKFERYRS